jgi:hypothetical protein
LNIYLSEIDIRANQERYNEQLRNARLRRLIREAQAARQPAVQPARPKSLIARVFAALGTRRVVGAWR